MSWEQWLYAVAEELNCDPEEILELYRVRELLFDGGASPKEAADYIRCYY